MDMLVTLGLPALAVTLVALGYSSILGIKHYVIPGIKQRIIRRAHTNEINELHDKAIALDRVITALTKLDREVHFRHNIHCPACGRFAKQAEGFPPAVSDCRYHGILARTSKETGVLPVEVRSIRMAQLPAEPPEVFIEPPIDVIPDDLSELSDLLALGVKNTE